MRKPILLSINKLWLFSLVGDKVSSSFSMKLNSLNFLNHMIKRLLNLLVYFVITVNVSAQTLERTMDNYFGKIGGKENVERITVLKEVSFNWFRRNAEDDPERAKPIKTMTLTMSPVYKKFVSFNDKGDPVNEFYYNEKGYVLAMGDYVEKKKIQTPVSVGIASDLYKWHSKQILFYDGEKSIGENDYYVIKKDDGKSIDFFYFNKKTFLLEASQLKEWPDRITYYRDYRVTNMILQPFLLESYQNDVVYYRQITDSCAFNPEINTEVFYFNEREYERRNSPSIKYQSVKLKASENDFNEFIKANFKNKRVLVDVWATWCAPCKKEFKNYDSTYYSFMEKNGISLLFLSIDKDDDKGKWEADVKRLGLKGYHARANVEMVQSLQRIVFDGGTIVIPRYILINDMGNFISKNFMRPSELDFQNEIRKVSENN